MGISGIGSYTPVTGVLSATRPYLYNTNRITGMSMNPIAPIGPDVVRSPKTDYSNLAGLSGMSVKNENPLKPFETSDFEGVLERQFALSQMNATRLFR